MQRRFKISVDGRAYDVVVEEIGAEAATHPAPIAHPIVAAAVAAPVAAPSHAAPSAGAVDEVAPLAGVVVSIDVAIGQSVDAGSRVATIEAMKMKTEVLSKLAGKVSHIAARANESVETGQVLMTIG